MTAEDMSEAMEATVRDLRAAVERAVAVAQEALRMATDAKAAQLAHERICELRQAHIAGQFTAVLEKQDAIGDRLSYIGAIAVKTLLSAAGGLIIAVGALVFELMKAGGGAH